MFECFLVLAIYMEVGLVINVYKGGKENCNKLVIRVDKSSYLYTWKTCISTWINNSFYPLKM